MVPFVLFPATLSDVPNAVIEKFEEINANPADEESNDVINGPVLTLGTVAEYIPFIIWIISFRTTGADGYFGLIFNFHSSKVGC